MIKVYLYKNEKVIIDREVALTLQMSVKELNRLFKKHIRPIKTLNGNEFKKLLKDQNLPYKGGHPPKIYSKSDLEYLKSVLTPFVKKIRKTESSLVQKVINHYENKGFVLLQKELFLFGQRPDIIFLKNNKIYLVEVMCGKLDKKHFYKTLEYRDLFFLKYKKKPKVLLVCEKINDFYKKICQVHKISYRIIKSDQPKDSEIILYKNRSESFSFLIKEINDTDNPKILNE